MLRQRIIIRVIYNFYFNVLSKGGRQCKHKCNLDSVVKTHYKQIKI